MSVSSAKTRRLLAGLVALAVLLAGLRAALPWWLESYVNGRIERMGEYRGHVDDVDIALFRGAYTVHELIVSKQGGEEEPFAVIPQTDISIEWSALFDGELVGEIKMREPALNLIQGEQRGDTQLGAGVDWPAQVGKLFPFRFNRIEADGGNVTFRAPGIETGDALTLSEVTVLVRNLTNVENRSKPAFASFTLKGRLGAATPFSANGDIDPNARQPTFDLDLSLEGARLVEANPWLREYLNVDAEKGEFSMFAELAAAEGRFEGYIKPILENAEILRLDEPSDGPLQKLWEGLVGAVSAILTNRDEDQVATQIPFSGELQNPDAGILAAAVNLVRNAFVAAFTHSLEGTVSIEEVREQEP